MSDCYNAVVTTERDQQKKKKISSTFHSVQYSSKMLIIQSCKSIKFYWLREITQEKKRYLWIILLCSYLILETQDNMTLTDQKIDTGHITFFKFLICFSVKQ